MNNSYLFEKELMTKHTINLGSTILGRFGAFLLVGLTILSLAGCGGGGGSDSGPSSPNMQIRPPSSGGIPDWVIHSTSVSDNTLTPGQRFTLSVTVRNQGDARAPATTLRYKSHRSLPIRSDDPTVGTDSVASLAPSETASESITLNAPSTAGTYHYGACVDSPGREENTGNNCSGNQGVRVTVSNGSGGGSGNGGSGNGGGAHFGGRPVVAQAFADQCLRTRRLRGGLNVSDREIRNTCNVRVTVKVACPVSGFTENYPFRGVYSFRSAGLYDLPPNSGWRPEVLLELCESSYGGSGRVVACVTPAGPQFTSPTGDRYTCLGDR